MTTFALQMHDDSNILLILHLHPILYEPKKIYKIKNRKVYREQLSFSSASNQNDRITSHVKKYCLFHVTLVGQ